MYYLILKQVLKVRIATERYVSLFNSDILKGKRIGIYEHSSAGRDLYAPLFNQLGAEVISSVEVMSSFLLIRKQLAKKIVYLQESGLKNTISMQFSQQMVMVIALWLPMKMVNG